ncbi:aldehyde dehydrogenase (NADP(+)) [Pedobacter sp. PAMC26386]|nr:aldehyde dehydrogenase (NADP(+)) [Pedobacter sp. PAMC26386]
MNGKNIVSSKYVETDAVCFEAVNPATGKILAGDFRKASFSSANAALAAAEIAFQSYRLINKDLKSAFLRCIADQIYAISDKLIARASEESGLPVMRLQGELGRTTGQLRLFADMVDEGSWVDAIIDTAIPERQPLPKSDIRRMLVPLGPVVVFGASNFPLAFSVAGGDTVSALAAGCPVIVKAHAAHLGTSALVGEAIVNAIHQCGIPKGVFSLLYDDGYDIGSYLVQHPKTKAVTFTGSFNGGMALVKLAGQRSQPIPVFAEMGSINPVILLPEAIQTKPEELAKKCAVSITMGAGQFCTNPGLLIAVQSAELDVFTKALAKAISETPSATMLTAGIHANYQRLSTEILAEHGLTLLAESAIIEEKFQHQSIARVVTVSAKQFLKTEKLQQEIFGPYSLLVIAEHTTQIEEIIEFLDGQLTITLMTADKELATYPDLLNKISDKAGRIILNGMPTGVEVCSAMQHGGPYPATNDSRFTSVGTQAIYRFARPVAWQDWEHSLLPDALKDGNPLGINRLVNQKWTQE